MRKYWQDLAARYDKLSTREQVLVAIVCVVLLYTATDALLLSPTAAKQKRAAQEVMQKRQEIQTMSTQLAVLEARRAQDPQATARARLRELQEQLATMEVDIRKQSALLIAAEQMPKVLERLLAHHPRVDLVELKTLPRVVLELGAKKSDGREQSARGPGGVSSGKGADDARVYRYGLEISIRGGYLDLLAYLRAVEAYPERFFWERAELKAVEYPVTTIKLRLYTMSLDSEWMRV